MFNSSALCLITTQLWALFGWERTSTRQIRSFQDQSSVMTEKLRFIIYYYCTPNSVSVFQQLQSGVWQARWQLAGWSVSCLCRPFMKTSGWIFPELAPTLFCCRPSQAGGDGNTRHKRVRSKVSMPRQASRATEKQRRAGKCARHPFAATAFFARQKWVFRAFQWKRLRRLGQKPRLTFCFVSHVNFVPSQGRWSTFACCHGAAPSFPQRL